MNIWFRGSCFIGAFLSLCFGIMTMFPPKPTPFRSMAFNDPRRAIMLQRQYAYEEMIAKEAQKDRFMELMLKIESFKKKLEKS